MMPRNTYLKLFLNGLYGFLKNDNNNEKTDNQSTSFAIRLKNAEYDLNNVPNAFCDSITGEVMHRPEMLDPAPDHVVDRTNFRQLRYKNPYNNLPITPIPKNSELKKYKKKIDSLEEVKRKIETQIQEMKGKLARYENQKRLIAQFEKFVSSQEQINFLRKKIKICDQEFERSIEDIKNLLLENKTMPQKQLDHIVHVQEMQHKESILPLKMHLIWELEQFIYSTAEVIIEYGFSPEEIHIDMERILKEPMTLYHHLENELRILQRDMINSTHNTTVDSIDQNDTKPSFKSLIEMNLPSYSRLRLSPFLCNNPNQILPTYVGTGVSFASYGLYGSNKLSMQQHIHAQRNDSDKTLSSAQNPPHSTGFKKTTP